MLRDRDGTGKFSPEQCETFYKELNALWNNEKAFNEYRENLLRIGAWPDFCDWMADTNAT